MSVKKIFMAVLFTLLIAKAAYSVEEDTRNVLKQGLLGAGTGAIASGASGGNAGTGALIGAGTGVIGGALLDAVTAPPASAGRGNRRSPAPQGQYYYDDEEDYDNGQVYYEEPPQESSASKVIKQGLLGAGTGALASGVSGGSAGKGALIGAGAGVIGGALLDMITQPPSQPKRVYRNPPSRQQTQPRVRAAQPGDDAGAMGTSQKKVIRKYDDTGKVVSEEEIYY